MCPSPAGSCNPAAVYLAEVKMIMENGGEDFAMPSPPHIYVRPLMRRAGGFEMFKNGQCVNNSEPVEYMDEMATEILIGEPEKMSADYPVTAL